MTAWRVERCTVVDSLVKSATIQWSEVGVTGVLADAVSAGISAFEGIGVTSDSASGASGCRVGCVGRIAFAMAALTGRGDRARG